MAKVERKALLLLNFNGLSSYPCWINSPLLADWPKSSLTPSANLMNNNNVPIGAIQKILGHENRTTTEIYFHSINEVERQAISAYERARENSHSDSHSKEEGLAGSPLTP